MPALWPRPGKDSRDAAVAETSWRVDRGLVRADRAGCDRSRAQRGDAVTIAAVADDHETLRVLLSRGASARQVTSRCDDTALTAAGTPLDHVNNLHRTAAIESTVRGDGSARRQATLAALIDAGAKLQRADSRGNTPLQPVRSRGFAAMVIML